MKEHKKTRKEWLDFYKKVLSDGCYTVSNGVVLKLYEDDRLFIQRQIDQIEMEIQHEP